MLKANFMLYDLTAIFPDINGFSQFYLIAKFIYFINAFSFYCGHDFSEVFILLV